MRRPFTNSTAIANGMTPAGIEWALSKGRIQSVGRGVYLMGREAPTPMERAAATVIATQGVACGTFAGMLHEMDLPSLVAPFATLPPERQSSRFGTRVGSLSSASITVVRGYRCTTGLQTALHLASTLDDLHWEQMLESGLRKKLFTIDELNSALMQRRKGNARMRRVLNLRPNGAPPTESVLETMMVQLMRCDPRLQIPTRQLEIYNRYARFEARVDLAVPELGIFFELDGQQHKDQPVYDANRQTRVIAATGWLVGRFTWDEVVCHPRATLRRIVDLFEMSRTIKRAG